MGEDKKKKILEELGRIYPLDLSVREVSRQTGMSDPTASTYLKVLEAQGDIEISRKVGNAIFYRFKKSSR